MTKNHYYTISKASRLLGKESNRKLVRRLIRYAKIETCQIGNSICIDERGLRSLRKAVKAWDARPRLSHLAST